MSRQQRDRHRSPARDERPLLLRATTPAESTDRRGVLLLCRDHQPRPRQPERARSAQSASAGAGRQPASVPAARASHRPARRRCGRQPPNAVCRPTRSWRWIVWPTDAVVAVPCSSRSSLETAPHEDIAARADGKRHRRFAPWAAIAPKALFRRRSEGERSANDGFAVGGEGACVHRLQTPPHMATFTKTGSAPLVTPRRRHRRLRMPGRNTTSERGGRAKRGGTTRRAGGAGSTSARDA
jgi:hypothetical protein